MRKYVLASIVFLPFLLRASQAAQNWPVDPPQAMVFSSEDSGTGSYLGVDIADVTADRLAVLKLKEEKGAEVNFVDPDAPAGKAGMKEHDVILSMNGTPIDSAAQLRRMIHETPAGRVVTFGVSRDGQPMTLKVQLGDKHSEYGMMGPKMKDFHVEVPPMQFTMPDIDIPSINMVVVTQSARSGLTVENITPQLGEFFGVKNGNGVLVRAVEKGSRAEKAGFHAGDVIVKINDQVVHDTSDFTHAVRSRGGNSVNVGVIREKKEQNLNLTLPERKDSGMYQQEETSDDLDTASSFQLSELQDQMAKLRPQMELAAEQARKSAEEMRKTLCSQSKQYLEQAKKQAEQARKEAEKQRDRFQQEQQRIKIELERMQQELRGAWMDI